MSRMSDIMMMIEGGEPIHVIAEYITRNTQMKFVMQQKHKVKAKLKDIYFQNKWEDTKINVLVKY